MKFKNKESFKKRASIVALALVAVLAVSACISLVSSLGENNAGNNKKYSTCHVWGHQWVIEYGKPATCQEDGYTTLKYCSKCDLVESEKVTLSKLNAHCPTTSSTGFVSCFYCHKSYGTNLYYVSDYISTTDVFAEGEYVTIEGTVILKGCSSGGSNYYLLLAGDDYSQVVRVSFETAEELLPFNVGSYYYITGKVGHVGNAWTVNSVDAYTCIREEGNVREIEQDDYIAFDSIESACRSNRENYFCKLVYIEMPYMCLSSATGVQANSVRFDNSEDVVDSESVYFTFSLRYLREFTNFTNGSVVTFGGQALKHKDKAAVQTTCGLYVYLASWGNSNLEFFILDYVDNVSDNG